MDDRAGSVQDNAIDGITVARSPYYEPMGWNHWPKHTSLPYQCRRGLGETQDEAGAVLLAASRMLPGDLESWHRGWRGRAGATRDRAFGGSGKEGPLSRRDELRAESRRPLPPSRVPPRRRRSARPTRVRGVGGVQPGLPRPPRSVGRGVRHPLRGGRPALRLLRPGAVPARLDAGIDPHGRPRQHQGQNVVHAGARLLATRQPGADGRLAGAGRHLAPPGPVQPPRHRGAGRRLRRLAGGARRRRSGADRGLRPAARALRCDPRLAACVSRGAIWSVHGMWGDKGSEFGFAERIRWVFGAPSMAAAMERACAFTLERHLGRMRCPYLVRHGGRDVPTASAGTKVYEEARRCGLDATLRLTSPDETGAERCRHDNPTPGQEILAGRLAGRFGIDPRTLLRTGWAPLL